MSLSPNGVPCKAVAEERDVDVGAVDEENVDEEIWS